MARHVIIFGAGIAGLAAAHELVRRGCDVTVCEASDEPGGFFRSGRRPEFGGLPTEYSWHGFGPWYHNAFAVLREIPAGDGGSLYDRALSRPIDFGIFPDDGPARFFARSAASLRAMFRLGRREFVAGAWLMMRTWCARRRSEREYGSRLAATEWGRWLGARGARTWRASFGPWIGSDWTHVSLHQAGHFFRKQLTSRPAHHHAADSEGPAWTHGAGDGWLVLRGPSSEAWFDPWVADLANRGVTFQFRAPLRKLNWAEGRIESAELESGQILRADDYILAVTPFAAAAILARTPDLERLDQLRLFRPLTLAGPHVQVSFRIGFVEPIRFRRPRTAIVVSDAEFNLTLFPVEQAWRDEVPLAPGIRSLWTGTACAARVPGRLFGQPLTRCTRDQFMAEVLAQLATCAALDGEIRAANDGRGWKDFHPRLLEVWPEWQFSTAGIHGGQPKWVNSTQTQLFQPTQCTPVQNLLLAGAHTRTEADVWSIEAAVESGRRAARAIDPAVPVVGQYRPAWLRVLVAVDDGLYALRGPHVLDVLIGVLAVALLAGAWLLLAGSGR